jgi:hypothetical protein
MNREFGESLKLFLRGGSNCESVIRKEEEKEEKEPYVKWKSKFSKVSMLLLVGKSIIKG